MKERIARLARYALDHEVYPQIVKTEYDRMDLFLPELKRDTKRLCEYMLAQNVVTEPDLHLTGFFRFDGSVPADLFHRTGHRNFNRYCGAFYNKPIDNLVTFEWQHSTADFARVIRLGLCDMKARVEESRKAHAEDAEGLAFLEAADMILDAIKAWQEKCERVCRERAQAARNEEDRERLLAMADTLTRVPWQPARTFRDAVQCLSLCFIFQPDCVGTMDRYLYPYYKADLDTGRMTREDAQELIQELYIDIFAHTGMGTDRRDFTAESHFAIGGYLADGTDGFNDLSLLLLDSLMEMPNNKPEISLRWTKALDHKVFRHVLDCERHDGLKRIAIVNDEPRVASFMKNLDLSYEDAVKYTMVGCNEPCFVGGIWLGGATANAARTLEKVMALPEEELSACESFDDFYALFDRELHKELALMLEYSDAFNRMRSEDNNVLSSLFLDGCIENARSATRGGCSLGLTGMNLMGTTCVIDSLSVIRQFVYEEKTVTLERLLTACRSNWEGEELLRRRILKQGRFFGNNDPLSDDTAVRFTTSLHDFACNHRNLFGNRLMYGCLAGYNPHYIWFGQGTMATPDGRHAGDGFMVGAGQSDGRDRSGLTSLLNSVAHMDPKGALCGPFVCNLMLEESLVRKDENFDKTVNMLEAYFREGGLHVQLNYVSKEELEDALVHPEKYGNLRVRVSGFSGTYTLLDSEMQQEILRRTSQK